eukprot:gene12834-biopygen6368
MKSFLRGNGSHANSRAHAAHELEAARAAAAAAAAAEAQGAAKSDCAAGEYLWVQKRVGNGHFPYIAVGALSSVADLYVNTLVLRRSKTKPGSLEEIWAGDGSYSCEMIQNGVGKGLKDVRTTSPIQLYPVADGSGKLQNLFGTMGNCSMLRKSNCLCQLPITASPVKKGGGLLAKGRGTGAPRGDLATTKVWNHQRRAALRAGSSLDKWGFAIFGDDTD